MKALIAKHDGYAAEQPETAVLTDMTPFVELADIERPQPQSGQVLVKVKMAAVNPSDEMFIQGLYGQPRKIGRPAGFEGVGEVVEAGSGFMAGRLKGKRVAFFAAHYGTWSEYALTDALMCFPVPDDVRDEDAAGLLVNPMTAWAMFDLVRKSGSKAFIMSAAASQLCKFMANLAKAEGYTAIGIVRRDEQIDMLRDHGCTHVLNQKADGFAKDLRALCKEQKPRVFLDAVTGPLAATVFEAMGPKARWVVYGRLDATPAELAKPEQMIFMEKRIEGFWLTNWFQKDAGLLKVLRARRDVINRFRSGEWRTDITAIVPLAEAIERVPDELAKPNGKVLIRIDGG